MFSDGGARLAADIESGTIPLPPVSSFMETKSRLYLFNILSFRLDFLRYHFIRYLMIDATSLAGKSYLLVREDRIRCPKAAEFDPAIMAAVHLHSAFETRICPLSMIGAGWGSVVKKSLNVVSIFLEESSTEEEFDRNRCQVRGGVADQGTESHIMDETIRILPQFRNRYGDENPRSFIFPWGLFIPGHLHLIYNALEEACQALSVAEKFFWALTIMCTFLGDAGLRAKYIASCCRPEDAHKFAHFPRTHVDWRWEFLMPALLSVLVVWHLLQRDYKLVDMAKSETDKLNSELLKHVAQVLADTWFFIPIAHLYMAMSKAVNIFSSKLEGCHCHGEIWKDTKRKWSARLREVQQSTKGPTCVFKGRQGPWFIAEGMHQLLEAVAHATSEEFEKVLIVLPAERRQNVLCGRPSFEQK